jgi:hypothetical protein
MFDNSYMTSLDRIISNKKLPSPNYRLPFWLTRANLLLTIRDGIIVPNDNISNKNYLDQISIAPFIIKRPRRNYLWAQMIISVIKNVWVSMTNFIAHMSRWNYLQTKILLLVIKITSSKYWMTRWLSHANLSIETRQHMGESIHTPNSMMIFQAILRTHTNPLSV